jgi:hypothetical protein
VRRTSRDSVAEGAPFPRGVRTVTTTPTPFDAGHSLPLPPDSAVAPAAQQGADAPDYRSLRTLGAWVVSLLALTLTLDVFTIAAEADLILALQGLADGSARTQAELAAAELRMGLLGVLHLLLGLVTVTVFLVWFHRAYRNLPSLGVATRRFGTGWAVGAWFVPFLNLIRPKQIADDIWRASVAGDGPNDSDPSLLPVHVWWGLFIGAGALAWIAFVLTIDDPASVGGVAVDIASRCAYMLAGIAALIVVYRITTGQEARVRRVLASETADDTRPSVAGAVLAAVVATVLLVAGAGFTRPALFADADLTAEPEQDGTTVTQVAPAEPEHEPVTEDRAEEPFAQDSAGDDEAALAVPEREPVQEPTTIWVDELTVGDCFDDPPEDELGVGEIVLLPCDQPHDNEVYALVELPAEAGAPYPDEDDLAVESEDACVEPFADYVGIAYEESTLWLWAIYPDHAGWRKGDRLVICALYDGDFNKLEGSMANSGL